MPVTAHAQDDHLKDGTTHVEDAADKASPTKKAADAAGGDAAVKKIAGQPGAVAPKVKDSGMLTGDLETKIGKLEKGTVAEVAEVHGADLKVKVWSGHKGAETTVPVDHFRVEPALAMKDDSPKERDDYKYEEFTSILWGPAGPQATDVGQGYLCDCYFNAAMGAVAAAAPDKIKAAFAPQKPNLTSYQVTLYAPDKAGKLQPKTVNVDTNLPTYVKSDTSLKPAYSGNNQNFAKHDAPLWPALLEKAYAQMTRGGYAKVGDGGNSDVAMEALTGHESKDESATFAKSPAKILEYFKKLQAEGQAVTCGTLSGIPLKGQGGFHGEGDGPYRANLRDANGGAAELREDTIRIRDKKGKAGVARDEETKIVGAGVASGSVKYSTGSVELSYKKDKGPGSAEDLVADFEWEGMIAPEYHLYGDHEYIFEKVEGENLVFKNPWGEQHPSPIPAKRWKELFDEMSSNKVGKGKPKK